MCMVLSWAPPTKIEPCFQDVGPSPDGALREPAGLRGSFGWSTAALVEDFGRTARVSGNCQGERVVSWDFWVWKWSTPPKNWWIWWFGHHLLCSKWHFDLVCGPFSVFQNEEARLSWPFDGIICVVFHIFFLLSCFPPVLSLFSSRFPSFSMAFSMVVPLRISFRGLAPGGGIPGGVAKAPAAHSLLQGRGRASQATLVMIVTLW